MQWFQNALQRARIGGQGRAGNIQLGGEDEQDFVCVSLKLPGMCLGKRGTGLRPPSSISRQ